MFTHTNQSLPSFFIVLYTLDSNDRFLVIDLCHKCEITSNEDGESEISLFFKKWSQKSSKSVDKDYVKNVTFN